MSSVLIVDDEPLNRELLTRWLVPAGYDVREAPDADTALTLLDTIVADVVMCDVHMPGHDGVWLVAQLRQRFPTVAVVLATADDGLSPAVSLKSGVVEYLVKPLDGNRVLAAVLRAVEWRQAAVTRNQRQAGSGDLLTEWLDKGGR
jgi:two-component system, chemotaxis family, chemotaxis protein CheY